MSASDVSILRNRPMGLKSLVAYSQVGRIAYDANPQSGARRSEA